MFCFVLDTFNSQQISKSDQQFIKKYTLYIESFEFASVSPPTPHRWDADSFSGRLCQQSTYNLHPGIITSKGIYTFSFQLGLWNILNRKMQNKKSRKSKLVLGGHWPGATFCRYLETQVPLSMTISVNLRHSESKKKEKKAGNLCWPLPLFCEDIWRPNWQLTFSMTRII